jgi:hypothetical protein
MPTRPTLTCKGKPDPAVRTKGKVTLSSAVPGRYTVLQKTRSERQAGQPLTLRFSLRSLISSGANTGFHNFRKTPRGMPRPRRSYQ